MYILVTIEWIEDEDAEGFIEFGKHGGQHAAIEVRYPGLGYEEIQPWMREYWSCLIVQISHPSKKVKIRNICAENEIRNVVQLLQQHLEFLTYIIKQLFTNRRRAYNNYSFCIPTLSMIPAV